MEYLEQLLDSNPDRIVYGVESSFQCPCCSKARCVSDSLIVQGPLVNEMTCGL